jgi:hypothetical protein
MARLQDVIGDTGREIGTMLLPKLTQAAEWLGKKIPLAVEDFKKGWNGVGDGEGVEALAESLRNLSDSLSTLTKQAGDAKGNGFVQFARWALEALTTTSEGFELLGHNWRTITLTISKWNDTLVINWQKSIRSIAEAGAKLPGPMGRHFRKIADEANESVRKTQAKLNSTNTRLAQSKLKALEVQLRHLGRQKPTPKVYAQTQAAVREIARIQARLRGIRDRYVSVFISEVHRDRATAGRAGGIPGRASGGQVMSGQPYIVGEHRAELFVPAQSGRIVPSTGGLGRTTYVINNHIYVTQPLGTPAAVGDAVVRAFEARPAGSRKLPAGSVAGR